MTVAALYVETNGCYFGLSDVDPWDEARDARLYAGPHPVVVHPPCQRWGNYWAGSPLVIARTGIRKKLGDDKGCFASALDSVRQWGGVLEHPANSRAWKHFELSPPPRSGGWVSADFCGGWTCHVEQGQYGHFARKPTWLYAAGVDLPTMRWGTGERRLCPDFVAKHGLKAAIRAGEISFRGGGGARGDRERSATPEPFRELLLNIARSIVPQRQAA